MKIKCSERQVQLAISDYLCYKKIVHWRVNSGAMIKENDKKQRFVKFLYWLFPDEKEGLKFLDIQGLMPNGKALFVECKSTGEKPTLAQLRTVTFLVKQNAVVIWADSIDMFIEKFNEELQKNNINILL